METTIYAHVVSPSNYYADGLEFELNINKYDVLNIYKIPETKKNEVISKWEKKGGNYKVLLGPVWNKDIKAKHRIMDDISELNYIYERITEDTKRLSLFNNVFIGDIYNGKLNIKMTEKHFKRVYNLINNKYKDNYVATERKEIWKFFFDTRKH